MPVIISSPFVIKNYPPGKVTFYGTGSIQTFVVPSGKSQILVKLWGAGGGSGTWDASSDGGGGGYAKGTLAVTPGMILDIYVGTRGLYSTSGGNGGWPGGGKGGDSGASNGGGGGGFSGIFPNGNFTTPYIIAGGGGGGGTDDAIPGGGLANWYTSLYFSYGKLGSQTAGGAGGSTGTNYPVAGQPGGFLFGGNGGTAVNTHGGGGGGSGYYGGGGGALGNNSGGGGPGGGGSSYIGHASLSDGQTLYNGNNSARRLAANEGDPDWVTNIGRGGDVGSNGNHGMIVIAY